jgi:hypothetical protein
MELSCFVWQRDPYFMSEITQRISVEYFWTGVHTTLMEWIHLDPHGFNKISILYVAQI